MLDLSLKTGKEVSATYVVSELLAWSPHGNNHYWETLEVEEIVQTCTDAAYQIYHQKNQDWASAQDKIFTSSWFTRTWLKLTGNLPKDPPHFYQLLEEMADAFKEVGGKMCNTGQLSNDERETLLSYIHKPTDVEAALRAQAI